MRSLSFVDYLQFPDIYTSNSRNLCLFDVDNDGDNELVLGFWDSGPLLEDGEADAEHATGSLYVTKYNRIWKAYRDLGMVLCVTAGHIIANNEPWILALCADSLCYAFDARSHPESCNNSIQVSDAEFVSAGKPAVGMKQFPCLPLKLVHAQKLAYNAKDICIINTDSACEIAVAYSDRVVRLYLWCPTHTQEAHIDCSQSPGRFVILIKWELAGQVNRIDTHDAGQANTMLIASQPGGGFAVLQRKFEKHDDQIVPTLLYYPPRVANTRNLEARSWLVGNVRTGVRSPASSVTQKGKSILAVCMADGTVLLLDPAQDDDAKRVLWCVQLHFRGELFGLAKLNFTPFFPYFRSFCISEKNDTDKVCVCAWDGTTYIFDENKEILRFPMGQSCQVFSAGWYAVEPGRNEPVLIYITCDQNLLVYYNLNIDQLVERSLFSEISGSESLVSKLRALGIDPKNYEQVRKAVRYLLYDYPKGIKSIPNFSLSNDDH